MSCAMLCMFGASCRFAFYYIITICEWRVAICICEDIVHFVVVHRYLPINRNYIFFFLLNGCHYRGRVTKFHFRLMEFVFVRSFDIWIIYWSSCDLKSSKLNHIDCLIRSKNCLPFVSPWVHFRLLCFFFLFLWVMCWSSSSFLCWVFVFLFYVLCPMFDHSGLSLVFLLTFI